MVHIGTNKHQKIEKNFKFTKRKEKKGKFYFICKYKQQRESRENVFFFHMFQESIYLLVRKRKKNEEEN